MSDKELISQIAQYVQAAFEVLFRKYFKSLCLYVQPLLSSFDQSEEAVQQTFIKIWEKRHAIRVETNPAAYLKRCVYNEALMLKRGQRNYEELQGDDADIAYVDEAFTTAYESAPVHLKLKTCIAALPDKIRESFHLSRREGLNQQEIADYLKKSKKTVEAQISRALQLLRTCLKEKK